jgi:hypothetical protein
MPVWPPLTVGQILAWADRHRERTGKWPSAASGPVEGAPGENWRAVNLALTLGSRGLPGGSSLARLLEQRRGKPPRSRAGPLTVGRILAWADRHHRRTGRWPSAASGPVLDAPGEHWRALDSALRYGFRGLPGGSSLARLLAPCRRGR